MEAELEALENIERKDDAILKEEVTAEEIAEIVAKWTGVPVTKLIEGEREKLLRLQSILHERVIGQNEAVEAVSEAILRARAGIKDPQRPIGSFLFLGPTGVGKLSWRRPSRRVFLIAKIMSSELICRSTWRNIQWLG